MNLLAKILIVSLSSYLLGAVPSSYIMGRLLRGIDLREHGSGNLGAANTFRVLGARAAIPVLLFDVGKGLVSVLVFPRFAGGGSQFELLAALAVVLGHSYSLFVGFAGGKGVGTTAGVFIALAPVAVGMCFVLWLIVLLTTRIVSLASIIASAFLPVFILAANRLMLAHTHPSVAVLGLVVAVFVIAKHRSNISRLRQGTEKRLF